MTGEMFKPPHADLGETYWHGKPGLMGMGQAVGDDHLLIRPNYPEFFDLADELNARGIEAGVEPFDVYQGPYVSTERGRVFAFSDEHGFHEGEWWLEGRLPGEGKRFRSSEDLIRVLGQLDRGARPRRR